MAATPRTYLVVIDESAESRIALRFAARRAAKTGGQVALLALIPPPEFVQWSGVQAAIEEEARERAEGLVAAVAGETIEDAGIRPSIIVKQGDPVQSVLAILAERPDVHALVLGARAKGGPGPLVAYFAGEAAGSLPCPLMVVPGGLDDAAIDLLS